MKKATTSDSIPAKKLRIKSEASVDVLHNLFNKLKTGNFFDNLKLADIIQEEKSFAQSKL